MMMSTRKRPRSIMHGVTCAELLLLFVIVTRAQEPEDDLECPVWGLINDTDVDSITALKACLTLPNVMKAAIADLKSNRSTPFCPSGYSGEQLVTIEACMPCTILGYYCVLGEGIPCPFGKYCPNVTALMTCPKGNLCLPMSIEPLDCPPFRYCPEGATNIHPSVLLTFLIFAVVLLLGWLTCCISRRRWRAQKAADQAHATYGGDFLITRKSTFSVTMSSVDISFKDVGLTLKSNGNQVLSGVTGRFPPKSVVALMGPSGSGKTTFMSVLLGRANYGRCVGEVKINGAQATLSDSPGMVGFVPQDDIVHPDLTVYQNLYYSAQLRLPKTISKVDKEKHIAHVVEVLGMRHVAHTVVGSPESRGVSGGQKKRVNIGVELAAMPAVLFMDEPTSGLDASAATQVMQILIDLAANGITVVCVIHQPRKDVFNSFSHLLLLGAGGRSVYCGRQEFVKQYLTSVGFQLPAEENPADWVLDVVSGVSTRYIPSDGVASMFKSMTEDTTFKAPEDLFTFWDQQSVDQLSQWTVGDSFAALPPLKERQVRSRMAQAFIIAGRCMAQHDINYWLRMLGVMFGIGAFVGYFSAVLLPMILTEGTWYTYAALAEYLGGSAMGALLFPAGVTILSTFLYGRKRLLYMREFSSGVSATAFWFAHTVYWSCLWDLFIPIVFSLPVYGCMVILQPYRKYLLVSIISAFYYSGIGMFLSILIQNQMACFTLLFFVPIIESMLGSPKVPGMSESSKYIGLRWQVVARLSAEIPYLPKPVQEIAETGKIQGGGLLGSAVGQLLTLPVKTWQVSTDYDEEYRHAIIRLLSMGLILRLGVLVLLLLSKYDLLRKCKQCLVGCCSCCRCKFSVKIQIVEDEPNEEKYELMYSAPM